MVTRLIPRDRWMAEGLFPAWYRKRIRARSTSRTGATREACNVSSRFCSSAVKVKAGSLDFPAMLPTVACQTASVNVLMKRCTSQQTDQFLLLWTFLKHEGAGEKFLQLYCVAG